MLKQQLILSGYRYSIYVAVSAFFFTCFLGYVSSVAVETCMKKAIIAGGIFGIAFFVSIKILVSYIPDNFNMVKRKDNVDISKPEE
ncbi:MAG: hypothetical protein ACYSR0_02350 [Planctomycetota bacterium]|jgi:hypothetical protein